MNLVPHARAVPNAAIISRAHAYCSTSTDYQQRPTHAIHRYYAAYRSQFYIKYDGQEVTIRDEGMVDLRLSSSYFAAFLPFLLLLRTFAAFCRVCAEVNSTSSL